MLVLLEPKTLHETQIHLGDLLPQDECIIFNLNSNVNWEYKKLDLIPKMGLIDYTSPDFDSAYISLLLNDEYYFVQLMTIMIYLKQNMQVFLLIYNEDTVFNPIVEVLMKLIQQRYGYNYMIAENWEDVNNAINTFSQISMFTAPGIITYDTDFDRYQQIIAKYNPKLFIDEHVDDSSF